MLRLGKNSVLAVSFLSRSPLLFLLFVIPPSSSSSSNIVYYITTFPPYPYSANLIFVQLILSGQTSSLTTAYSLLSQIIPLLAVLFTLTNVNPRYISKSVIPQRQSRLSSDAKTKNVDLNALRAQHSIRLTRIKLFILNKSTCLSSLLSYSHTVPSPLSPLFCPTFYPKTR